MKAVRVGAGGELGRRLLSLLVVATWLPLLFLSWISLREYESQLKAEETGRLAERAKTAGLAVFGHLDSLRSDIAIAGADLPPAENFLDLLATRPAWRDRFERLILVSHPGAQGAPPLPALAAEGLARLREGRSALVVDESREAGPAIWLVSPRSGSSPGLIWGQAKSDWIWPELAVEAEDGEGLLLFASDRRRPIASSPQLPAGLLDQIAADEGSSSPGLEWRDASGRKFLARSWSVPLGFEFGHPGLTVMISEPYRLWSAIGEIRRLLFLLTLGSLLLIALVGIRRLRSDLGPLEKLAQSARLMASGDLSARVDVGRPDEVGRLAEAFNQMASELERRFHQVEGTRSIAASTLVPNPSTEEVARAFVEQAVPLAGGLEIVVAVGDGAGGVRQSFSTSHRDSAARGDEVLTRIFPAMVAGSGDGWVAGGADSAWRTLSHGKETVALVGVVGGGSEERLARTVLLNGACDHLALAFAHVRLLEELDRANWGALTALARAVDAKSAWTHGHSVRVAEIAAAIAADAGRSERDIRRIRRGCLVHDVGKIGVPNAVLDKAGRLEEAEVAMLRSHVEKGARILEPISGLAEVLPIVWQHHERLDGSGYPNRLRAGEIDPDAALVAVADVFEALTVARPYRKAWELERVEGYLRGLAGVQFDAAAVDGLFRICERHRYWTEEPAPSLLR